jgi:MFS transporter, DHA3 family, tetracycline resistance protein
MRRLPATTVFLIYQAANGLLFRMAATMFAVFLFVELGFDPLQLLLMGTVLEVSYLLFEIPTGVVADTVSRRLSVLIGLFGVGIAFILLGISNSFLMAAFSQVVWGVFATFESGADVAWLTDEVGEEEARPYYLKGEQAWQIGSLVGIVAGVTLAAVWGLRTPIVVSGVGVLLLGVVMIVIMREERFSPRPRAEGEGLHQGLVTTFKEGAAQVRGHPILLLILGTAALHGISTEGFDRLADLHVFEDIGLPALGGLNRIVWFGILDGVGLLLGLAAIQFVRHRVHLEGHARVARLLSVVDVALVGAVVIFAFTDEFWLAALTFWLVGGLRNVREPIFTSWINQGLDPKTRATVNSIGTQADAIGQAAGGPAIGVIAKGISVPWAIGISGLLRLPVLALYLRAIRRGTVGTVTPDPDAVVVPEPMIDAPFAAAVPDRDVPAPELGQISRRHTVTLRRLAAGDVASRPTFAPNAYVRWDGMSAMAGVHRGENAARAFVARLAAFVEPGSVEPVRVHAADGNVEVQARLVLIDGSRRVPVAVTSVFRFDAHGRIALWFATPQDPAVTDEVLSSVQR